MQVEVTVRSRLEGRDVEPGEVVEIPDKLAERWFLDGRARRIRGPGRPAQAGVRIQSLDAISGEELGELTRKNLLELARANGIEVPKKANKQELVERLLEAKEDEEGQAETAEAEAEEPTGAGPEAAD